MLHPPQEHHHHTLSPIAREKPLMAPNDLSTNERVVAAVLRLLPLGDLPHRDEVAALSKSPTAFLARQLTDKFLAQAEKSCAATDQPHTVAERLARHVAHAADLAYDVRVVVQGPHGRAPHRQMWLLLVAVLTCLVIAPHTEEPAVAREKLRHDVTVVALSLTDL